jgi:hypothetical protein
LKEIDLAKVKSILIKLESFINKQANYHAFRKYAYPKLRELIGELNKELGLVDRPCKQPYHFCKTCGYICY